MSNSDANSKFYPFPLKCLKNVPFRYKNLHCILKKNENDNKSTNFLKSIPF